MRPPSSRARSACSRPHRSAPDQACSSRCMGRPRRSRAATSQIRSVLSQPSRCCCAMASGSTPRPKRWTMPSRRRWTLGRAPNRAMLRAVGFRDGDFGKPIVGIASAHSTITPCNAGLDRLAHRAEQALRQAGAMPQTFGTITVSDGISMGTEGMRYSLVSREVIADSIETACGAQRMDGLLAVGGCDKNMPGAMIAIARLDIPAIFVYGGTIKPGHYAGRDLTVVSVFEAVGAAGAGR